MVLGRPVRFTQFLARLTPLCYSHQTIEERLEGLSIRASPKVYLALYAGLARITWLGPVPTSTMFTLSYSEWEKASMSSQNQYEQRTSSGLPHPASGNCVR